MGKSLLYLWSLRSTVILSLLAVPTVTPQEVVDRYVGNDDVFLLDVREPSEYEAGHIPEAIPMAWNSGVLQERWTELPTDQLIVVYCASGGRSARASDFLAEQDLTELLNMTGGFNSYKLIVDAPIATGPYETPVESWFLY